jgi:ribosomal protein L40E
MDNSVKTEEIICKNCGAEIRNAANFCYKCGSEVVKDFSPNKAAEIHAVENESAAEGVIVEEKKKVEGKNKPVERGRHSLNKRGDEALNNGQDLQLTFVISAIVVSIIAILLIVIAFAIG